MDPILEELHRFKQYVNGNTDRLIQLAEDENYHLMNLPLNRLFSHFKRLQEKIDQEIVIAIRRNSGV